MSLGDGLARGLQKYLRAKKDQGLRALLTGDVGIDEGGRSREASKSNGNGKGNGHGQSPGGNGSKGSGRAVGSVLSRFDSQGIGWQQAQYKVRCPDCQGELRFGEGCMTCEACGFSKC